jgi:phosphatidylserine/phosphatidylglycerophosphate/cardiolipin synthase-like enzyme
VKLSMVRLRSLGLCVLATVLVATMWSTPPAVAGQSSAMSPAPQVAAAVAAASSAGALSTADKQSAKKKKGKSNWGKWKAPRGAFFNNPHLPKDRLRIERRLLDTLRHARKKTTVRIAIYSMDRIPVANAIVAAHKRGVRIQILINDHWENKALKIVRAQLGANRWKSSFIYKCKSGCRSHNDQYRNLHSKFFLFPHAGKSKHVLAIGSHNFTNNANRHQWNDTYFTEGDKVLFNQFVDLFKDMRKDYNSRRNPYYFCGSPVGAKCDDGVDKHTNWVFPKKSTPKNDVVLTMLDRIKCLTPDGNGGQVRTKLALSMHTMRGNRGNYLAAAIRRKWAEGCAFRVSYGLIGYKTKQVIGQPTSRGRIPLRSTGLDYNPDDDFDLNNDGEDDVILTYYSHQKYFIIQGNYAGNPNTNMVLTGSSNWASLGTAQDEVFFTVRGGRTVKQYLKNFNLHWNSGRYSRNAYTTTYTNFRTSRRVQLRDGSYTTVVDIVRRPVLTVERDPYKAGGPYWEGD